MRHSPAFRSREIGLHEQTSNGCWKMTFTRHAFYRVLTRVPRFRVISCTPPDLGTVVDPLLRPWLHAWCGNLRPRRPGGGVAGKCSVAGVSRGDACCDAHGIILRLCRRTLSQSGVGSGITLALVLQGAVLMFFSFIGFEDILNVSEEVKNPKRDIPFGIVSLLILSGGVKTLAEATVLLLLVVFTLVNVSLIVLKRRSSSPLSFLHRRTIFHCIGRMQQNLIARGKPGEDLGKAPVRVACFDGS